jgi:hypothetical protein
MTEPHQQTNGRVPSTPQANAAKAVQRQTQAEIRAIYSMPPEFNDDSKPVQQHHWI